MISQPQGVFFEDLLFSHILDFEILMDLGYFLDINHLIWYGFCWFLVFSWVLIGFLSGKFLRFSYVGAFASMVFFLGFLCIWIPVLLYHCSFERIHLVS